MKPLTHVSQAIGLVTPKIPDETFFFVIFHISCPELGEKRNSSS